MPDLSLLAIESAIHAALETITTKNGGVFTTVNRWAGKLPRAEQLPAETFSSDPTATLLFDRSQSKVNIASLNGLNESVETIAFSVIVSTADQRGADIAFTVDTTTKGVGVLIDAAKSVLNGLIIPPVHSVLTVKVSGTANKTISLAGILKTSSGLGFRPNEALSAALDANGEANIKVRCIRKGTPGNIASGALTWSVTEDNRNSIATIVSLDVTGVDGLLYNKPVRFTGSSYLSSAPSQITAVQLQFECQRRVQTAEHPQASGLEPLNEIRFDGNVVDSTDPPNNPINQGKILYE